MIVKGIYNNDPVYILRTGVGSYDNYAIIVDDKGELKQVHMSEVKVDMEDLKELI